MSNPTNKPGVPRVRVTRKQATEAMLKQLEKTVAEKMKLLQHLDNLLIEANRQIGHDREEYRKSVESCLRENANLSKEIEALRKRSETTCREQVLNALGFQRSELGWSGRYCTLSFDVELDEVVSEVVVNANVQTIKALAHDLQSTLESSTAEHFAKRALRREQAAKV